MIVKWYGTASVGITDERTQTKILFDPFVPLKGSDVKITYDDFDDYDTIFITHGHFDHIGSLKKLCKRKKRKIYCTKTPYNTLIKKGVNKEYLTIIKPNDIINIDTFTIKAYQSKHIEFDEGALKEIIFRRSSYKYLYNVPYCAIENKKCLENGEILLYYITCQGKSIITMGSLGVDDNENYPLNCDLFMMPYQGKKDLLTPGTHVINKLKPKKICLIHWDNTFPPVSKTINTVDIQNAYKEKIEIIKPIHNVEIIL